MNIFIGNPYNAMEFYDFKLILSTLPWSFTGREVVAGLLKNNRIKIFSENIENDYSPESKILRMNDYVFSFGYMEDILNYDFYFYSLVNKVDMMFFYLKINSFKNIDKIINTSISSVNSVKIDSVIIVENDNRFFVNYVTPNSTEPFVFKEASYAYFNLKKNKNKYFVYGKYYKELKNLIKAFSYKVIR